MKTNKADSCTFWQNHSVCLKGIGLTISPPTKFLGRSCFWSCISLQPRSDRLNFHWRRLRLWSSSKFFQALSSVRESPLFVMMISDDGTNNQPRYWCPYYSLWLLHSSTLKSKKVQFWEVASVVTTCLLEHSLIRGVLIQSCSAGAKKFTNYVFCHPQFSGVIQNIENCCAILTPVCLCQVLSK